MKIFLSRILIISLDFLFKLFYRKKKGDLFSPGNGDDDDADNDYKKWIFGFWPEISRSVFDAFRPHSLYVFLYGTEEFYRADESRCGREHFGMGLAIVNRLVQSLNGALELSNAPKGGAVVTVTLFV